MYNLSKGITNSSFGYQALQNNTTGYYNSAFGVQSLLNNTTGNYNTSFGNWSLRYNTTSSYNTAFGEFSLGNNGTGVSTFTLSNPGSGFTQSTTFSNIQLSYISGSSASIYPIVDVVVGAGGTVSTITLVTTGTGFKDNTTVMGSNLGGLGTTFSITTSTIATGNQNTAVGYATLYSNTTGYYNTAIGLQSLYKNTTGYSNTAVGRSSLYYNTSGYQNTAIGNQVLFNNTTGYYNNALGYRSLENNTNGSFNTSIGIQALGYNTTGSYSTALGHLTLRGSTTVVSALGTFSAGSGYVTGTYSDILLTYSSGSTAITYPTATIVVGAGGTVSSVTLSTTLRGVGFKDTTTIMSVATSSVGGGTGSGFTIRVSTLEAGIANTALGHQALLYNITGSSNISIGFNSMNTNSTGSQNVAIGGNALFFNTTGSANTALGFNSSYNNTTGTNNTAIGWKSLYWNTTGTNNSVLGYQSLFFNTTGTGTIAIGYQSLYNNTIGSNNVAVGYQSLYNTTTSVSALGTFSTGVGYVTGTYSDVQLTYLSGSGAITYPKATIIIGSGGTVSSVILSSTFSGTGFVDTTTIMGVTNSSVGGGTGSGFTIRVSSIISGQYNSAIGYQSLYNNTNGQYNTAVGHSSLRANTTGLYNTAIGNQSLTANTSGLGNTSLGHVSMQLNTTGYYNTAIGYFSSNQNTSGGSNTTLGAFSLYFNQIGSNNVAIGYQAGQSLPDNSNATASNSSIFIGRDTRPSLYNNTNEIVIGTTAIGNGSDSVTLGNDSITKTILKGNVGIGLTGPSTKLHIYATQSGAFRLVDGTQGSGKVLISDSNGVATWTSSIQTQLDTKLTAATGTINYLQKVNGVNSLGNSSIFDDGSGYIGINNVNTPTKDITLGNQINREIGIEQSNSVAIGRNLIVSAGRTINYNDNSDYNLFITSPSNRYWGMANMIDGGILVNDFGGGGTSKIDLNATTLSSVATGGITYPITSCQNSNGDIYQIEQGSGNIYKKTFAGTAFVNTGISAMTDFGVLISFNGAMTAGADGQIYVFCSTGVWVSSNDGISYTQLQTTVFTGGCKKANGDILALSGSSVWKRTGGSGLFIDTAVATTGRYITETPNGNVFVSVYGGSIWMQTNGSGPFTNLNQTIRSYNGIASDSNGNVFVCVDLGGLIYKQNNSTVGTADLRGGTLKLYSGTGKGTGASDIEMYTGQATASGTDMQISTLRLRIDNEGNVGIGTATPSTTLHVYATQSGAFRLQDGTQASGYVLTSDANGVGSWSTLVSGSAATSSFYLQGTSNYSYDTTSNVYRTGSINIGTGTATDGRFVVSSSGGTVSLIVDNSGNIYNNGISIYGYIGLTTKFGYNALILSPSSEYNTAFGYNALGVSVGGNNNAAFGINALSSLVNDFYNTAVGSYAAATLKSGQANTAIGYGSYVGVTASGNVTIGSGGNELTTGSYNTFLGGNSGRFVTTGSYNIILGANSIISPLTTGSYNVIIGKPSTIGATVSNSVFIADMNGNTKVKFNSTGTMNISSVAVYTDNAAALSAGLVVGDVYRTGDFLKIVR